MPTDKKHDPYKIPLTMDPFASLLSADGILVTLPEEAMICDGDVHDLRSILVRPNIGIDFLSIAKGFMYAAEDPFAPGALFEEVPRRDDDGDFSYTLLFALRSEDADEILGKKMDPAERSSIMQTAIELGYGRKKYLPIGYGTLHGSFTRNGNARLRAGVDDEGEDFDPKAAYSLFLQPYSFFISLPFRGRKLGTVAGAALAGSIIQQLEYLNDLSTALGIRTNVNICNHFELHTFGGEAAVKSFHRCLEFAMDTIDEANPPGVGLSVVDIVADGGF